MKSSASNSVMAKIAKLIKSKESFEKMGSINEAETFAAKIQSLLDEHNLSMGEISIEERMEEFTKESMNHMIPSVGGNTAYDIMRAIAKHNYCRVYLRTTSTNKVLKMSIYGSKENIEVCKYIYNSVKPVFMKVGKDKFKEAVEKYGYKKGLDTYLRAFLIGCGVGLDKKLEAEKQVSISKNVGLSGLIKVNDSALKQWIEDMNGPSKKIGGKKVNDNIFQQGVKTGKNVQIHKAVDGKTSKPTRKLIG